MNVRKLPLNYIDSRATPFGYLVRTTQKRYVEHNFEHNTKTSRKLTSPISFITPPNGYAYIFKGQIFSGKAFYLDADYSIFTPINNETAITFSLPAPIDWKNTESIQLTFEYNPDEKTLKSLNEIRSIRTTLAIGQSTWSYLFSSIRYELLDSLRSAIVFGLLYIIVSIVCTFYKLSAGQYFIEHMLTSLFKFEKKYPDIRSYSVNDSWKTTFNSHFLHLILTVLN